MFGVLLVLLLTTCLLAPSASAQLGLTTPQQVHLSLTADSSEMAVTWVTELSAENEVEWGLSEDALDQSATGGSRMYEWTVTIHSATMTNLSPNEEYFFRVGGASDWSGTSSFWTAANDSVHIAAIADHSTSSAAEATVQQLIDANVTLVTLSGDLSYANGYQPTWDEWGEMMEPSARRTPWMFAPGNHEEEALWGFAAYEARFSRPDGGSGSPFWYSFHHGPVTFISISSEHEYTDGSPQLEWLDEELALANASREAHPWVIVLGHKPMYSSNSYHGSEVALRDAVEHLLVNHSVDLAIWGHDHSYERTYPVIAEEVFDIGDQNGTVFASPTAPVHLVVGTAGQTPYDDFDDPQPGWSAHREASFGIALLDVDRYSLKMQFQLADGSIADEFTLNREIPLIPTKPAPKKGLLPAAGLPLLLLATALAAVYSHSNQSSSSAGRYHHCPSSSCHHSTPSSSTLIESSSS